MTPPVQVIIRPEAADGSDDEAVRAVNDAAFGRDEESRIVEGVRLEPWFERSMSLVAVEDGRVVGHVLLSRCTVERPDGQVVATVTGIGPVAVLPERQRRGIGSALMHGAIDAATARRSPAIVLVGHPTYYPRFGFVRARSIGLEAPAEWPDEAWMALPLPDWTPGLRGVVRFPPAFG